MDKRIKAVLLNNPGMGIFRQADTGYKIAIDFAKEHDINIQML
jgi:urocanate hydratase